MKYENFSKMEIFKVDRWAVSLMLDTVIVKPSH